MSAESRQCPSADCERFDEPQHSIICYGCGTPTYVVDAWGDRTVDASVLGHGVHRGRAASEAAEHRWRVDQIRKWEAAYRDAHDGAEPPPGFAPPIGLMPGRQHGRQTNTFAILALIFGVMGGLLAVPFGHIGIRQTRDGAQGGHGMAVVGLVLGYLWLCVWVVYFVQIGTLVASF